jgi:rubrerythrin
VQETMERDTGTGQFPVDDATYDLMVTLTEKLQAIETYQKYSQDVSGREQQLYQKLIEEDSRHATEILELLRERLR